MTVLTKGEISALDLQPDQTLLSIHAHPDDFEMSHSALAEKAREQGISVALAVATYGGATTLNFVENDWPADTPIADIRKHETTRACAVQHIAKNQQYYFNLPDAKLHTPLNRLRLGWHIARTILRSHAAAVVTPGQDGFDGHSDHKAIHRVTLSVAKLLRLAGKHITVWATTVDDAYDHAIAVDAKRKKQLVRLHASQFPEHKPELFDRYEQLLKHERYIRVC